jgi:hypothetical protein
MNSKTLRAVGNLALNVPYINDFAIKLRKQNEEIIQSHGNGNVGNTGTRRSSTHKV